MHSKHEPHLLINLADCFHVHCLSLWCIHCNSFTHEFFLVKPFLFLTWSSTVWGHKGNVHKCWQNHISVPTLEFGWRNLKWKRKRDMKRAPQFLWPFRVLTLPLQPLHFFSFIMQFYLKRDYNTLKEVFHINTVITYSSKTYILFSFGKLPSS